MVIDTERACEQACEQACEIGQVASMKTLNLEDQQLVQTSVQRLCRKLGDAYFAAPEKPCTETQFQQALEQCITLGLLNHDSECALWQHADLPQYLQMTVRNIQLMAAVSPALAFMMHRRALAYEFSTATDGSDWLLLSLQGRLGMGRDNLIRWWQQKPVDEDILEDVFGLEQERLVLVPQGIQPVRVILPVFAHGMHWYHTQVNTAHRPQQLGLDELGAVWVRPEAKWCELEMEQSMALSQRLWHQDWLGLLAIQLGAVQSLLKPALSWAQQRFQGGRPIIEHAAVQQLLGQIRMACRETALVLDQQTLTNSDLSTLLLLRTPLQQGLRQAAHAAMQIYGGIGYMQDTGVEKTLRAIQQLSLCSGSPLDMSLSGLAWESLDVQMESITPA